MNFKKIKMNLQKSALLIIDMQNDFMQNGSLEVPDANELIKPINELMELKWGVIVASKDWHPANHISFASNHKNQKPFDTITIEDQYVQTLWPNHCVENTFGAEIHNDLNTSKINHLILKGTNPRVDSYSAFFDNNHQVKTQLDNLLNKIGITDIYVVGLAADYCVFFTAIDGANLGYNTHYIIDATRFINASTSNDVIKQLISNNISISNIDEIMNRN